MVFNLFHKSDNSSTSTPSDQVQPSNEQMVFDESGAPAKMHIEDIFFIHGRGTVVTGTVEAGTFQVGQKINIQTESNIITTTIASIEAFRKTEEFVSTGSAAGFVLPDVDREAVQKGNLITAA